MTFIIHKNLDNKFDHFPVKNGNTPLIAFLKIPTYTEIHFAVISLSSISISEIISLDYFPLEKSERSNIYNKFQTTLNGHQKARKRDQKLVDHSIIGMYKLREKKSNDDK